MTGEAGPSGRVYLVGTGPGDPELMTVTARRLLEEPDAVLHDEIPGPDVLAAVPEEPREDVGTRGHGLRRGRQSETDDGDGGASE